MRFAAKLITIYIGLSVFLGLLWAILSYPNLPSTPVEWVWVFALALPLQLAGEFLGEILWKNKVTQLVAQKTAEKSVSLLRIFYLLLYLLVFAALLMGAGYGWSVLQPWIVSQ